jgi:hypothetical protein
MRYHKKIYFPTEYMEQIKILTQTINDLQWRYSSHCLDRIKTYNIDIKEVLLFVKDIKLTPDLVFEFYTDLNFITKLCYRIPYNDAIDLILVIGEGKKLITIYYNTKDDEHYTLQKDLYTRQ